MRLSSRGRIRDSEYPTATLDAAARTQTHTKCALNDASHVHRRYLLSTRTNTVDSMNMLEARSQGESLVDSTLVTEYARSDIPNQLLPRVGIMAAIDMCGVDESRDAECGCGVNLHEAPRLPFFDIVHQALSQIPNF